MDLVIKNGTVVNPDGAFLADVGITGESVTAVGENLEGERTLDARGHLVVPGGVDVHVHLEYPVAGLRSADDYFTGTRAAALGGTTAVIDFVETGPGQTFLQALEARRAPARERAVIDYGFHMTIKPEDLDKLDQVAAVVEAGCPSFKHYMAYAFYLDDGRLLKAFQAVAEAGGLAIVHAENWKVICALIERNLGLGRTEPRWHPRSRPERFEGQAARRAIDLARLTGARLYVFHVSCHEVVRELAAARAEGLPVWGETCPQYLLLDDSLFERPGEEGRLPICAPPIRPKGEQEALWQALARGDLQVVSTDHCPFTRAEKARGDNFSQVPGGVPSIEGRLNLVYSAGVASGRLTPSQWVDCCCSRPARLHGFEKKGRIAPGFDADLVVFDPAQSWTVSTETLHEQVDWTPYQGLEVQGKVVHTLSRGELVVESGSFVGRPGRGRFVPRRL